ncbi:acyltransferase family protein, partial [Rhodopseudomonas palustris]
PLFAVIFHPMTLEFILGGAVGLVVTAGAARFGATSLCAGVALLAGGWWLYGRGPQISDDRWARVVYLGIAFVPIVYGVVALELNRKLPVQRWATRLGDASYSTYLSHVLTLSLLGRIFVSQPIHNAFAELVFVILCVAIANAVGLLSFDHLELRVLRQLRSYIRHGGTTAALSTKPFSKLPACKRLK